MEVAQLYLGDPAAAGEPPRQLVDFKRVALAPGQSATVGVRLTRGGGDETLHDVILSLQLSQGWSQQVIGSSAFPSLSSGQAAVTEFKVTPPSWEPATNEVVHATAQLGPDAQRQAGVTVGVG